MTALRAVRPNRACEARSSSPMYASTSTIRPTGAARAGRPVPVTDEARAEQRPCRVEGRPREDPARKRSSAGAAHAGSAAGHPAVTGRLQDRLRDEERDDAHERRDDVLVEDLPGLGPVDRVPDVAQERQLVVVLGNAGVEVVLVEDDRDEQEEQRALHDAQDPAQDLVHDRVLREHLGFV